MVNEKDLEAALSEEGSAPEDCVSDSTLSSSADAEKGIDQEEEDRTSDSDPETKPEPDLKPEHKQDSESGSDTGYESFNDHTSSEASKAEDSAADAPVIHRQAASSSAPPAWRELLYAPASTVLRPMIVAQMTGTAAGMAVYALLSNFFFGFPRLIVPVFNLLAKYQIPLVAIPVTLIYALRETGLLPKDTGESMTRVIDAGMEGAETAVFSYPMLMELISLIVQGIKDESITAPVEIPDAAAGVAMGCIDIAGLLNGISRYYQTLNRAHPDAERSRCNEIMTGKLMTAMTNFLHGASIWHTTLRIITGVLGFNPMTGIALGVRAGLTLFAGGTTAAVLRGQNPEPSTLQTWFQRHLMVLGIANLLYGFMMTFILMPPVEQILEREVREEQYWLMTNVLPGIILFAVLGNVVGQIRDVWRGRAAGQAPTESTPLLPVTDQRPRPNTDAPQLFFSSGSSTETSSSDDELAPTLD